MENGQRPSLDAIMSRRDFLTVSGLTAATAALVACAPKQEPKAADGKPAPKPAPKPAETKPASPIAAAKPAETIPPLHPLDQQIIQAARERNAVPHPTEAADFTNLRNQWRIQSITPDAIMLNRLQPTLKTMAGSMVFSDVTRSLSARSIEIGMTTRNIPNNPANIDKLVDIRVRDNNVSIDISANALSGNITPEDLMLHLTSTHALLEQIYAVNPNITPQEVTRIFSDMVNRPGQYRDANAKAQAAIVEKYIQLFGVLNGNVQTITANREQAGQYIQCGGADTACWRNRFPSRPNQPTPARI